MSFFLKPSISLICLITLIIMPLKADPGEGYDITGRKFFRYESPDTVLSEDSVTLKQIIDRDIERALNTRGVIYRGINLNASSGAGITSGFNLELSGEVSENIEVSAYISDDNLALADGRATGEISDIDRIYIQFRHPNFMTRMGNYDYDYQSGDLGNLRNEYSGVFIKGGLNGITSEAFISAETPESETMIFSGMEGVSGPYILMSKNIRKEIIRGSETVYLNGSKLVSGSDYVMDYYSSELFFRPRTLIRENDRITVDFRSVSSDYEKTAYGAGTALISNNAKIRFDIHYFKESDNRNKPLGFDLNNVNREILEASGGSGEAFLPGYEFREGKGDYDLISPDSINFVFSGRGKGDYAVRFSHFESGGEYYMTYDSLGTAYFVYGGEGAGKYLPLIAVSTPVSYSRIHTSAGYKDKYIEFDSEFAASGMNRNIYSSDQEVLDGFGDTQKLKIKLPGNKLGRFDLGISRKHYGNRLQIPSRLKPASSRYEADYSDLLYNGKLLRYEGKIIHNYGNNSSNIIEAVSTKTSEGVNETGGRLNSYAGFKQLSFRTEISRHELSDRGMNILNSHYFFSPSYSGAIYRMSPFIRYRNLRTERSAVISDNTERTAGNIIGFNPNNALDINNTTEYEMSEKNAADSGQDNLDRLTNVLELKGRSGTVLNSELVWTKVITGLTVKDTAGSDHDLLSLRSNYNRNNIYRADIDYGTERTVFVPKVRSYYQVEEGTGSYIFADGEYYPDEFGDFEYHTVFSDRKKHLAGVFLDVRTFFDPDEKESNENILFWLSKFDAGQDILIREKSKSGSITDIMFLNLRKFQNDSTVNGLIESKTALYFLRKTPNSFEYNYSYRKNMFREFQNYSENDLTNSHFVSYRNIFHNLSNRISLRYSSYERYGFASDRKLDDITKKYFTYGFRHNFIPGSDYSVTAEFGTEHEKVRDVTSESVTLNPSLTANFGTEGIFRAGADIINIRSSKKLPFSMNSGMGTGWSLKWNISSSRQFSENISADISYRGRKLSYDRKAFHELSIEARMDL